MPNASAPLLFTKVSLDDDSGYPELLTRVRVLRNVSSRGDTDLTMTHHVDAKDYLDLAILDAELLVEADASLRFKAIDVMSKELSHRLRLGYRPVDVEWAPYVRRVLVAGIWEQHCQ